MQERSGRRLTLRDLLTDAEKRIRDLQSQMHNTWVGRASDLRELSRPLRKKSHFPSLAALLHAIERLIETQEETEEMFEQLFVELEEIREHAKKERLNRP
jgi:hypothetical protein